MQELTHLTNSFAQLKQAQAKFKACVENVREINPQNQGGSATLRFSLWSRSPSVQTKLSLYP